MGMNVDNAIALLGGGKREMTPAEQVLADIVGETGDSSLAYDVKPTRLTTAPGGGKSFQDGDGKIYAAPLRGVIIEAVKTRAYWPEKDGSKIPFCSSVGAMFGVVNPGVTTEDFRAAASAPKPHHYVTDVESGSYGKEKYACAECPMSEFGSAHQGVGDASGQACKAKVMFLFLPEGWSFPCLVSVSTMSIKPWSSYASSLKQQSGREFYAFFTEIDIEKKMSPRSNKAYGQLKFSNLGAIEDVGQLRAVGSLRAGLGHYLKSRETVISEDDYVETNGRVVDEDGVIVK